ncbi:hypothetical protein GF312_00425 [Candidatus Poribacteria bacterium]|nr:hypothetical protein [Candidatus Poribacteria bacterium]
MAKESKSQINLSASILCIPTELIKRYCRDDLLDQMKPGIEEHIRKCELCQGAMKAVNPDKLEELLAKPEPVKRTAPAMNRRLIEHGEWMDVGKMLTEDFLENDSTGLEEINSGWSIIKKLYTDTREELWDKGKNRNISLLPTFSLALTESNISPAEKLLLAYLAFCDRINQSPELLNSRKDFNNISRACLKIVPLRIRGKALRYIRNRLL